MSKPKLIAFYLPQFHPTPENNEWWGNGFTEWTNVAKAKALFPGHMQPKIPKDLGFYDLRLPESRAAQAELAKEAGVSAFCYYHYWFEGKQILNRPFDEVLKLGEPDFPFCLAWANHDWYKNHWTTNNKSVAEKSVLLLKQTYGGVEEYTNHFYACLNAFKDKRYFKINGKNVFVIYNPFGFNDAGTFMDTWRRLAAKENIADFFFITHIYDVFRIGEYERLLASGYDAVNISLHRAPFDSERNFNNTLFSKIKYHLRSKISLKAEVVDYSEALEYLDNKIFEEEKVFPTLIPNWDHTPRSGKFGRVLHNCTPELFGKHIDQILKRIQNKKEANQIIFLKSWNEWGEGNYVEPDLVNGKGYIYELAKRFKD